MSTASVIVSGLFHSGEGGQEAARRPKQVDRLSTISSRTTLIQRHQLSRDG